MLEDILNKLMNGENILLTLGFFTIIIVLYSFFVYVFYRFLARKNIINLNLNKYNHYHNPTAMKFFAALFYIIEYLVLLPIVTFFWFAVLAVLTLILSQGMSTATVLIISAALVAAVRITSFISEDLSRDLAKMLPFGLLSIAITSAAGFIGATTSAVSRFSEIPALLENIPYYLVFIVGVELAMRILSFIFSLTHLTKKLNAQHEIIEESTETE